MTAPAIAIETVEEFDLVPNCECRDHVGPPARAEMYVDQHDCTSFMVCRPCIETARDRLRAWLKARRSVKCTHCRAEFRSYETFVTREVPIR